MTLNLGEFFVRMHWECSSIVDAGGIVERLVM